MKYLFTYLVLCICIQTGTSQWLVLNNDPVESNEKKALYLKEQGNSSIYFPNLKHPCIHCNKEANIDLFMIFSDGSHYNSRYCIQDRGARTGSMVSDNCNYLPDVLVFGGTPGYGLGVDYGGYGDLQYMKMTRKKDTDDPPEDITITESPVNNSSHVIPPVTDWNIEDVLSASNDVVPGKDIVVVVKKPQFDFDACVFYAQQVEPIGTGQPINNLNLFNVTGIFDNSNIGSVGSFDYYTELDFEDHDYLYASLVPNYDVIRNFLPNEADVSRFRVVFAVQFFNANDTLWRDQLRNSLKVDVEKVELIEEYSYSEIIRNSHDPNFFKAEHIFVDNGKYYIRYKIQVQNTSTTPTKKVIIKKKFLPVLGIENKNIAVNNIRFGEIRVAGNILDASEMGLEVSNNEIQFIFDKQLQICDNSGDPSQMQSKIIMSFDVEVDEETFNTLQEEEVFDENPDIIEDNNTVMDNLTYPIHAFYDIERSFNVLQDSRGRDSMVWSNRPISNSDDYIKPYDDQYSQLGHYYIQLKHCIEEYAIILGGLVTALLLLFFYLRRRKKEVEV